MNTMVKETHPFFANMYELDTDAVMESIEGTEDESEILSALDILMAKNHYSVKMDKFVTFGAPQWLISDSSEYDTGEIDDVSIMKRALALHRVGLPALARSQDYMVRAAVAYVGFEPEKMIADTSPFVRAALAYRDYELGTLANDRSDIVRANVAMRGYCLEDFLHDRSPLVRRAVASNRKYLDILVKDPNASVREEVAKAGYGLDTLIRDSDPQVRMCAANALITENAEHANADILESGDECVRKAMASQGLYLSRLVCDPSSMVRTAVAQRGFASDVLAKDEDPCVRSAVVSSGYVTDALVNDPSTEVRVKLATDGYDPRVMCKDHSPVVRGTVALYGHELSRLMGDNNASVAKIAMSIRDENFRKAYAAYNVLIQEYLKPVSTV